eukprot:TRINITY_DN7735_c0_g1_i4.p3 TRINITY_DN7735_c0_g1~~TRINITY_DN7735_c0_g1_i4.p3  ORF type:complete len:202 (-),score=28.39 TRINITY_DN7735_c0_g1_i4:2114-2719(-)
MANRLQELKEKLIAAGTTYEEQSEAKTEEKRSKILGQLTGGNEILANAYLKAWNSDVPPIAPPNTGNQGNDVTLTTRMSWLANIGGVPLLSTLQSIIDSYPPLIPLNKNDWDEVSSLMTSVEMTSFFQLDVQSHCHLGYQQLWRPCITPRPISQTEDSWHSHWDAPVTTMLDYYSYSWQRNTNENTSSDQILPLILKAKLL